MIDGNLDADFAALERTDSLKTAETPSAPRVRRSVLATLPANPDARARSGRTEGASLEVVEVPVSVPQEDPVAHLQSARTGFVLAAVLVIYWIWIRKRRKR